MTRPPDTLVLTRNRDLQGMRTSAIWVRRAVLAALTVFLLLGLANLFGQRPQTATASSPEASLQLNAPSHLRGGLLFGARFHIDARRALKHATLVLDPGWAEGMTINTIEPSPVGEASRDGKLAFDLGHIRAGSSFVLYVQFQVNPTNVGRRSQDVELDDGDRPLLHIDRTVTIFP